jgi:DNA-binding beta-propeller fold protein YncE
VILQRIAFVAVPLLVAALVAPPWTEDERGGAPQIGAGAHTYRWVEGWGALPEGMTLGNTHGAIVSDSQGRIYVNTDGEHAVLVFEASGKLVKSWGKEWQGGLHGMAIVKEGGRELLWIAHTSRHTVAKTTLDGEVLATLPWPEQSGKYEKQDQFNPTAVAVAPGGEIFVADGYGRSWVHKYDSHGHYQKSFGGPGTTPGQMQTPHGLAIDPRGAKPLLVVADRENHRLQFFDLAGGFVRLIDQELRRPCSPHVQGDDLVVADLNGRVSIFGKDDKLVCHLGDNPDQSLWANNGAPRDAWKTGLFIAPHSARWDAQGDLYVQDWVALGRVTKLERVR